MLAGLNTLFMREHNKIAETLKSQDPSLDADVIFEEARRINTAQYQHIVYNEFLPLLIGLLKTIVSSNTLIYTI